MEDGGMSGVWGVAGGCLGALGIVLCEFRAESIVGYLVHAAIVRRGAACDVCGASTLETVSHR